MCGPERRGCASVALRMIKIFITYIHDIIIIFITYSVRALNLIICLLAKKNHGVSIAVELNWFF